MSGVAVENSTLTLSGDHAKEGGGWHWLGGSLPGGRQRQRGFAGKVGGLSRLPPLLNKDNIEYYSVSISNTRNAKIFIKGALLFIPLHMQ